MLGECLFSQDSRCDAVSSSIRAAEMPGMNRIENAFAQSRRRKTIQSQDEQISKTKLDVTSTDDRNHAASD